MERNKKNTIEEYVEKLRKIKNKQPLNANCKYCDTDLIKGINIINKGIMCYNCLFSKWYNNTTGEPLEGTIKCNCCSKNRNQEDFIETKQYKNCSKCRSNNNKKPSKKEEDLDKQAEKQPKLKETFIKIPFILLEDVFSKVSNKELNTTEEVIDYLKL